MVAAIRKRLVEDDRLISEEAFSEGLALANILPGPVAVNVAAWCGYLLAGIWGAFIAVIGALLPSFIMMVSLFFIIQWVSHLLNLELIIFLVSGVAFGLILSAGIQSARKSLNSIHRTLVFIISLLVLFFFSGYWIILSLILIWSLLGQLIKTESDNLRITSEAFSSYKAIYLLYAGLAIGLVACSGYWFFMSDIFRQFSRISLTLFGGGYVIVPLLNSVLVEDLQWISQEDLLMGISLGQLTPGPLLISVSYFGQKIGGMAGAIAAVAGMFFPAALVMITCGHFMSKVRSSRIYNRAVYLILPFIATLIVFAAFSIFRSSWSAQKQHWLFIYWGLSFGAIHFFKVKPMYLIGLAFATGLLTLAL